MAPSVALLSSDSSVQSPSTGGSSKSEELLASRSQSKKRRIPGACDVCKRKKIRCDSGELPGNRCSNCIQAGLECTHKEVTKALGSAKGYVESLEMRLDKMDKLLRRLLPGVDLNEELNKPAGRPCTPKPLQPINSQPEILGKLSRLTLNPTENRYFGKSSQYELLQTALDLREEFTGEGVAYVSPAIPMKRREFYDVPSWMTYNPELDEDEREYLFPDEDLCPSLIDAYFTYINPFLPLLHRPTFQNHVDEGLHHEDSMFARVFLMVCAHGARYSDDPRVLSEGTDSPRSAGWKWFEQVNVLRKNLFNRTGLYELQMHALYVSFASSSEMPQGVWAQIGMALRLSQEVGGHLRRRVDKQNTMPTAEDELWKRAFWVILTLDRLISSTAGRPCGLQEEDYDLDLPLEVDDEYWDQGFVQPEGKPSSMAYFITYLNLMEIVAYTMRLIYSSKNSRFTSKTSQRSEQQIIAELDAAMNNWMDSVPEHLKWNPGSTNDLFLKQSSALHATYYHVQILIHRPFIPSPRNPKPGAFPSLAICTNAARSCCHVLEAFSRLSPLPSHPFQVLAFTSGLVLLLNIWSGKRSGFAPSPKREMEDVQRCMDMLKTAEHRSASAGRFLDMLTELASAGDIGTELQKTGKKSKSKKRSRSDSQSDSSSSSIDVSMASPTTETRNIAGTRRVSLSQQATSPISPIEPPINFLLPMYSNDLGRLPVYGQFNFTDPSNVNAFLGEQLGQILTSVPTKTAYHFDQPPPVMPNLFSLTSDPVADMYTSASDSFALDSMLKDAVFNSYFPTGPLGNEDGSSSAAGPSNIGATSTSAAAGNHGASTSTSTSAAPPPPTAPLLTQPVTHADSATLFSHCSSTDYTALAQQLTLLSQLQQPILDMEMMKMWTTAPACLELDEWGSFISNVEQLTQATRPGTS
ncbi:hypothetical protein FA15DRAFT_672885 [Coprinopsis marcescibilis]|uniref:Zn(2)-C6 fungal-type domain-containing protein n=1 Tax=Coprinopsis marcescibilis TaxID=230819 RepID=A0A5C3KLP7_COPMA|nr:hypothetical protein FA15DRAFT_672885 [Coprinopsis marcescibilis]